MIANSYNYQSHVYAQSRQIDAQVTITINGTATTYYDQDIVECKIVEEVSVLVDTMPSNQIDLTMKNTTGTFDIFNNGDPSILLVNRPQIDVKFGLHTDTNGTIEWIPMGTFWVDSWKHDIGSLTVTLTGHDNLSMLQGVSISQIGFGAGQPLRQTVIQALNSAGSPQANIDISLNNITPVNGIASATNVRQILQWAGILANCVVYQDRYGVIQIVPYSTIDKSSSYLTYASSSNAVGSMYSGYSLLFKNSNAPEISTGNGMKVIDHTQSYEVPAVTLNSSVYQVNVKSYDSNGTEHDNIYTNPKFTGSIQNGQSFTIDNPFVSTSTQAQAIANAYFTDSNYNVNYQSNWRQNPVLECSDVCVVEGNYDFSNNSATYKWARIYKQEFEYKGYLSGMTYSKGGY
jgi:hypothetical protein